MRPVDLPARQGLVAQYRTRKPDAPPGSRDPKDQLPAPDWLWLVVDAIVERCTTEPDHGIGYAVRAIAWCQKGDPQSRSDQLRRVIADWPGERARMIQRFLEAAEKTNAGRKVPRPAPDFATQAATFWTAFAFQSGVDPRPALAALLAEAHRAGKGRRT